MPSKVRKNLAGSESYLLYSFTMSGTHVAERLLDLLGNLQRLGGRDRLTTFTQFSLDECGKYLFPPTGCS